MCQKTVSTASRHDELTGIIKNSDKFLLPELASEVERLSISDTTLTPSPPLGLDAIYSEFPRCRLPMGLRNTAASY